MPRAFSSGALSIDAKSRTAVLVPCSASTFVIAAVSVVLPWSMCPMVPTFRCGLVRSNFCFPIAPPVSLRSLRRRDDLARDRLWRFFVAVELHRESGAALRHRAQVRRIPEHRRKRHSGAHRLRVTAGLESFDPSAARVEITHDVAEILLGGHDLDGHDRLEQLRLSPLHRVLESHRASDLEGHLARVDVVVRAVDELDADVYDRIAGQDARLHRLLDAEVDGGDVLARDLPADDLVEELVPLARLGRLHVDDGVAVLAAPAGLADEAPLDLLHATVDRLAVGDLRPADVGDDAELAL